MLKETKRDFALVFNFIASSEYYLYFFHFFVVVNCWLLRALSYLNDERMYLGFEPYVFRNIPSLTLPSCLYVCT